MTTNLWNKFARHLESSKILGAKFFFDNWPAFSNEAVPRCWSLCFTALNPDWAPAVNLSQRAKQIMWEIPRHISFFIYKVSILQLYQSGIYALSAWAELLLSFPVGTSCSNRLDFEHFDLQNPSATKSIHTNFVPLLSVIGTKVRTTPQPFSFDILQITSARREGRASKKMSNNLLFKTKIIGVSIKAGQSFGAKYKGNWEHWKLCMHLPPHICINFYSLFPQRLSHPGLNVDLAFTAI